MSDAALGVTHTWPDVLTTLVAGTDLGADRAEWAMNEIMSGAATPAQIAGFLMALRAKGETVEEMRGIADQMLAHANRITVPGVSLDVVGTGGDRAHTVNISTMAAMVCAAAGVRVVKHGNRAASSSSGSADVLEALGIDLGLEPSRVAAVAEEAGITFCFAQAFHPGFRHAGGVGPGGFGDVAPRGPEPAGAVEPADVGFAGRRPGAQRGRGPVGVRGGVGGGPRRRRAQRGAGAGADRFGLRCVGGGVRGGRAGGHGP